MSRLFYCSYLGTEVELSKAREQHIVEKHPETLPNYLEQLAKTLRNPEEIRRSDQDSDALLFFKWFDNIRSGRYLVVVVVNQEEPLRRWIVTAYTDRKLSKRGEKVWPKNT